MSEVERNYESGKSLAGSGILERCFLCERRNTVTHPLVLFRKSVNGDCICKQCDDECDEWEKE
jgi:hypothetical protein